MSAGAELKRWDNGVGDQFRSIMDFMEFIQSKGVELDFSRANAGTILDIRTQVYEFLEVDPQQLDRDRVAILDAQRKANEKLK